MLRRSMIEQASEKLTAPVVVGLVPSDFGETSSQHPVGQLFEMPDGSKVISLIDQLNAGLRESGTR